MAFKQIHAFEHLGAGVDINVSQARAGIDFVRIGDYPGIAKISTPGGGSISRVWGCIIGANNKMVALPFNNVGLDMTKRVIIGVRVYGANPALTIGIGPGQVFPGTGAVALTVAQLGTNFTLHKFLEFVLDPVALTTEVYVDGQKKYTRNNTLAEQNLYSTTHCSLVFSGSEGTRGGNGYYFTDLYFRDSSEEDTPIKPLGNFTTGLINAKSVSAPGWTATPAGTDPVVLNNTQVDNPASPVLQTEKSTMQAISIAANTPANPMVVRGVKMMVACGDSETPKKTFTLTATNGANTSPAIPLVATATPTLLKMDAMFKVAPDGSAWTSPSINATTFKITPT